MTEIERIIELLEKQYGEQRPYLKDFLREHIEQYVLKARIEEIENCFGTGEDGAYTTEQALERIAQLKKGLVIIPPDIWITQEGSTAHNFKPVKYEKTKKGLL